MKSDPAKFTLEYCEQALRDNGNDTAMFYGNVQRAIKGKRWRSSPKMHKKKFRPKVRAAT